MPNVRAAFEAGNFPSWICQKKRISVHLSSLLTNVGADRHATEAAKH